MTAHGGSSYEQIPREVTNISPGFSNARGGGAQPEIDALAAGSELHVIGLSCPWSIRGLAGLATG